MHVYTYCSKNSEIDERQESVCVWDLTCTRDYIYLGVSAVCVWVAQSVIRSLCLNQQAF
mgnify:CR=1 FL=1